MFNWFLKKLAKSISEYLSLNIDNKIIESKSNLEVDESLKNDNIDKLNTIKFLDIDFNRISTVDGTSNYKQFSPGNISSLITTTAGQGIYIGTQATQLFKATVDIETLMRYSTGAYSSIVQEGGRYSAHHGFISVGMKVFTPIIIFQTISIITGQYFFNILNKQLNDINKKTSKILQLLEIEKQAKIKVAHKTLDTFNNLENIVSDDLSLICDIIHEIDVLKEEYVIRVDNEKSNIYSQINNIVPDESKERLFFKGMAFIKNKISNKVENQNNKVAKIDYNDYFVLNEQLCYLQELLYSLKVMHLKMLFKSKNNRVEENIIKIKELKKEILSVSDIALVDNDFYKDVELFFDEANKDRYKIMKKVEVLYNKIKYKDNKDLTIEIIKKDFQKKKKDLEENKRYILDIFEKSQAQISDSFSKSKELILEIKDGKQMIYIKE